MGKSLWKGVAVPYCLYGSEVTNYREADIQRLEKVQNTVGRWGLGAPRSTAVEAIRGDMGWSTFKERIVKGKLGFLKKIEESSGERWAKRVMLENRRESTWSKETERWKRRENLRDVWNETNIKGIKKKIEENGLAKWQEGTNRKATLKWYKRKQRPEGVAWHVGDVGSKLLYKARTRTLEVNGRNREGEDPRCRSCRMGVEETVEHVIVECSSYENHRARLMTAIKAAIGEEEWVRRVEEEDAALCTVLGLYGNRQETESIVSHTKRFLTLCWEKRALLQG